MQTSIFHHIFIRKGGKEVFIKVRSTSSSRKLRDWGTKPIAVKWSIGKSAGGKTTMKPIPLRTKLYHSSK